MFQNPDKDAITALLRNVKTIAVVGLSPRPERPSHYVSAAMQRLGFRIVPVRPGATSVLGEQAYASLRDIPFAIDMVDVFRAPDAVGAIVDDCVAMRVPRLWLQDGVINEHEAQRAQAAGIQVVMNRCMWRDANVFLSKD